DMPLLPDPDKVRIRVYQTNSTHKSMSALRQGSMILVWDDDFHQVEGPFEEAFFTHTSTSPNQQIIASLDLARRQMELEGYDLTQFKNLLADRFDIQLNKTSRNSVLVQTNINNTRSDAALLIKVLADLSREIEQRLAQGGVTEQVAFAARVKSLMTDVPDLPN